MPRAECQTPDSPPNVIASGSVPAVEVRLPGSGQPHGACDEKDLVALGLMLCCHHLEILYNFLTMALHFRFSLGPANSRSSSFPHFTLSASL